VTGITTKIMNGHETVAIGKFLNDRKAIHIHSSSFLFY